MLLLHWAVNSDNNQYFVGLITNADFEIQNYFKQIIESVMQQQQDGSFKDGQFCLPSMDNSGIQCGCMECHIYEIIYVVHKQCRDASLKFITLLYGRDAFLSTSDYRY